MEDILWIEKHRPKSVNDMVLSKELTTRMNEVIQNPQRMPHFLFIGTPGSGKTTLARILLSNIIKDDTDVLIINGSDQRGIKIFRELIPEFLSIPPIASPIKIVFIDEADGMTPDAKKSFRAVLEKFHNHARFIMTANDDTFTPAIKSRFEIIKFTKLDKEYILDLCKRILDSENVKYNESDIKYIIDMFYPDTRKIVGTLQQNSVGGQLTTQLVQLSNEDRIVQIILNMIKDILSNKDREANMNLLAATKFVTSNYVDYYSMYKTLFDKLSYKCIPLKITISKYLDKSINSVSPSMIFYEFIDELKQNTQSIKGIIFENDLEND